MTESRALNSELAAEQTASGLELFSAEFAQRMDDKDPLAKFRGEFHIPRAAPHTADCVESVYLCGNSLGLMPKRADKYVQDEMAKWRTCGVEGHFLGDRPWVSVDEACVRLSMPLVGAKHESEIAVMNSLSCNLHLMMVSFYRPTATRHKILIEEHAFCSDQHIVRSQIRFHGLDIDSSLVTIAPRQGETFVRTEDVLAKLQAEGDSIALVMLGGVQFYTGQFFDIERITQAGHAAGARVGWDLAHCVGNVPVQLHDWQVDFACWCSYKYLNAGPGSISGVFLHSKHHQDEALKRFDGWWGQTSAQRFRMEKTHQPKSGAQAYQMSNPPVLPAVCLQASLEVFAEAGIDNLRAKSRVLTGYLEALLQSELPKDVSLLTPADPDRRGCQLSLKFRFAVGEVHKELEKMGVICDVRRPDVMRISPAPLYNSFSDVFGFVSRLKKAIASQ